MVSHESPQYARRAHVHIVFFSECQHLFSVVPNEESVCGSMWPSTEKVLHPALHL